MGPFAAGQVVIVHFPFSDLTAPSCARRLCWPRPDAAIGFSARSQANPMETPTPFHWVLPIFRAAPCVWQVARVRANFSRFTPALLPDSPANCSRENSPLFVMRLWGLFKQVEENYKRSARLIFRKRCFSTCLYIIAFVKTFLLWLSN